MSAELPHRLRVLWDDGPSSRHDALLLASRRAPWRGPSSTDASMAAERPQRQRRAARVPRAARGECEGRPRGRWFSGLFCGRPAPPSRKRTWESIAALAGQAGSAAGCRREARSFVEARGGPDREAGRGIPKGPPLGAGPGRREPRVLERDRLEPRGPRARHADFVYASVNNRSMQGASAHRSRPGEIAMRLWEGLW